MKALIFLRKNGIKLFGLFIIIALAFLILVNFLSIPTDASGKGDIAFAVIDISKVISAHQLGSKLYQMDAKIGELEQSLYISSQGFNGLREGDYLKVQSIHQKASEELSKEVDMVKVEMDKQEAYLKEKLKTLEAQTAKALKEVKEDEPKQASPQKISSETFKNSSNKFIKELVQLQERHITAKKLELQKELEDKLSQSEEAKDKALYNFETELLKASQNKKINLQFKYNLAPDEEAREEIKKEIEKIEKEDAEKLQLKKQALQKEYEKLKITQAQKIEKDLIDYQRKLEADIAKQLQSKGLSPKEIMYSSSKKTEIIKKFEASRKILSEELIQAQKISMQRLEIKRKELQEKLKEEERKIVQHSKKQQKYFSKYKEKQQTALKSELDKLKKERKDLYESIMADIGKSISKIAEEEGISVVVGSYMVNIDCDDLTDLVLLQMRKEQG